MKFKECSACKRLYLESETTIILYGLCKDCLIEKLKCCENCKHWKWQDGDDLSKNSGVYYCESKLGGNELFSGKCDGWEIYK